MNELTETGSKEVSTDVDYGIADELGQEDCERGRIGLAQPGSEYVKQDLARQGAFVNLSSHEELGYKEEKPLEFIIVDFIKYWIESDADTQAFIRKFPAINERELPWKECVDGRNVNRMYTFSYLVVLPSEIEAGFATPYELAFRSTELQTTKKINSWIKKLRQQGTPSWGSTFKLTSFLKSKDKFSWFATTPALGRKATDEEKSIAKEYRDQFTKIKTDIMKDTEVGETGNGATKEAEY